MSGRNTSSAIREKIVLRVEIVVVHSFFIIVIAHIEISGAFFYFLSETFIRYSIICEDYQSLVLGIVSYLLLICSTGTRCQQVMSREEKQGQNFIKKTFLWGF